MTTHMKEVITTSRELTFEEQTLFSTSYRSVVNSRRVSILNLSAVKPSNISRDYCAKIQKELESVCEELLQLIDENLLPMATSAMSRVYYYKMYSFSVNQPSSINSCVRKGDYNRYLAEYGSDELRGDAVASAEAAYKVMLWRPRPPLVRSDQCCAIVRATN